MKTIFTYLLYKIASKYLTNLKNLKITLKPDKYKNQVVEKKRPSAIFTILQL